MKFEVTVIILLACIIVFLMGSVFGDIVATKRETRKINNNWHQFCLTNNIVYGTNDAYGQPMYLRK